MGKALAVFDSLHHPGAGALRAKLATDGACAALYLNLTP
jgi:hypothetical protein